MKLNYYELLAKFPFLNKFKDQKWISANGLNNEMPFEIVPLHCAFVMIENVMEFLETTKFTNGYEVYLSTKVRIQQIKDLLEYFCQESVDTQAKKGTIL